MESKAEEQNKVAVENQGQVENLESLETNYFTEECIAYESTIKE